MPDNEAFLSVCDLRVEYRGGVPGVAGVSLDLQAGGMAACLSVRNASPKQDVLASRDLGPVAWRGLEGRHRAYHARWRSY